MMPNVMCSGVLGVAGFLLLKTPLSEEQRMYLEIIKSSGDSLLRIISDVLDLSKIEAHNLALEWLPFTVKDQLKEALALLEVVAREKGLEVGRAGGGVIYTLSNVPLPGLDLFHYGPLVPWWL